MREDAPALRPDHAVDLILSPGVIRRTFVLDIVDDHIVLANTRRALDARNLMLPAILTYLNSEQRETRYGFDVSVTSLSDDYALAGQKRPAAFALKTSCTRKMNLSVFPRIMVSGLSMFLGNEPVNIVDVSSSRVLVLRKKKFKTEVKVGETVMLSLARGNETLEREARILRLWHVRGLNGSARLAVRFLQPVDF